MIIFSIVSVEGASVWGLARVACVENEQRLNGDACGFLLAADLKRVGLAVAVDGIHRTGPESAAVSGAPHEQRRLLHGVEKYPASHELLVHGLKTRGKVSGKIRPCFRARLF